MKKLACSILFLFFLSLLASAVTQSQSVTSPSSTVGKLVDVQTDFSLENLVPGSEYKARVAVSFAIPAESLKNLNEERLVVNVHVTGARPDSWTYFKGVDGTSASKFNEVFFTIECVVREGQCAPESNLLREIPVFYNAPAPSPSPSSPSPSPEAREDGIFVEASLNEFSQQQILKQALDEFRRLQERVAGSAGASDSVFSSAAEAEARGRKAVEKAQQAGGDDGSALEVVRQAAAQAASAFEAVPSPTEQTAGEQGQAGLPSSPQDGSLLSGLALLAQDNWLLGAAFIAVAVIGMWHHRRSQRRKKEAFEKLFQ